MFNLLTRNWWVLILRGLLAILFGVLAFSRPGHAGHPYLVFRRLCFYRRHLCSRPGVGRVEERNDRWLLLLQGIIGVGIGIITFRAPEITALSLLLYLAAWSLAIGVLHIAAAIHLRKDIEGEGWLALSGVASILFAAILMWAPAAGALGLLWFIGSYAILYGAILVALGFKVHSLRRHLKRVEA